MLHERTTSAINLRMESGRRHAIRNLKAKVRSLLPQDTCPRERKRKHKSQKLEYLINHRSDHLENQCIQLIEKKNNKIFQKLTKKEIQEINENKHYFLDNEQSVALYEGYVREAYPDLVQHEWAVPKAKKNDLLPFAFIPSNLINPSELTSKKIASEKRLLQKRNSGSKSLGILRKCSIPIAEPQFKMVESQISRNKASACLSRKQEKEQQDKIKREINSVHLQRSQQEAEAKKQQFLKEKSDSVKARFNSSHFGKYDQRRWGREKWIQSDITSIATQLRRVCLHRKKESLGSQFLL